MKPSQVMQPVTSYRFAVKQEQNSQSVLYKDEIQCNGQEVTLLLLGSLKFVERCC